MKELRVEMHITVYQEEVKKTDRLGKQNQLEASITIPVIGLISESGGLLAMQKKLLRDFKREVPLHWKKDFIEELGDVLWYTTSTSQKLQFSLLELSQNNLLRSLQKYPERTTSEEIASIVTFNDFQRVGNVFNQFNDGDENSCTKLLLGLIAEGGKLVHLYNNNLREKASLNNAQLEELIGNILWYLSALSNVFKIDFNEIANQNIQKVKDLWLPSSSIQSYTPLFDEEYNDDEKIPRLFEVKFQDYKDLFKTYTRISVNNVFVGNRLTDNSLSNDGYRFHDVFHFANAAVLGWSPVVRSILKRKRKSNESIDEKEDGARASIIEEAVVAINFDYAKNNAFFKSNKRIESSHFKVIKSLVSQLEVSHCIHAEWQSAIIQGFRMFNNLKRHSGGIIRVDLINRKLTYLRDKS
jgi:NTP pyrophosphatase (non-canonical NTP hydrolase)